MLLELLTDLRAPKKMGSRAMSTRLPYASAVPSAVATKRPAVPFPVSVPFSVLFRPSSGKAEPCSTSAIAIEDQNQEENKPGAEEERERRTESGVTNTITRFSSRTCCFPALIRPRFPNTASVRETEQLLLPHCGNKSAEQEQ